MTKAESKHQWYLKNKERILQQCKEKYEANKEKILERRKTAYNENKEVFFERNKEYRKNNKTKLSEYNKSYREKNKDILLEKKREYLTSKVGRATYLAYNYKQMDKQAERGECTITPEWIIDNIFSKSCKYCGKTDWHELGCDRIDNSRPHTEDNVVCCCGECNVKKHLKEANEFKINGSSV